MRKSSRHETEEPNICFISTDIISMRERCRTRSEMPGAMMMGRRMSSSGQEDRQEVKDQKEKEEDEQVTQKWISCNDCIFPLMLLLHHQLLMNLVLFLDSSCLSWRPFLRQEDVLHSGSSGQDVILGDSFFRIFLICLPVTIPGQCIQSLVYQDESNGIFVARTHTSWVRGTRRTRLRVKARKKERERTSLEELNPLLTCRLSFNWDLK